MLHYSHVRIEKKKNSLLLFRVRLHLATWLQYYSTNISHRRESTHTTGLATALTQHLEAD